MASDVQKVTVRITIQKVLYDNIRRSSDTLYTDFSHFLPLLYDAWCRERGRLNPPPKPRKLSQAELRRLEEDKRYNEEMEERKKEAKRGQEIMNDRLANPDRYKTQADKDWERAQAKNDAYVPGSLLDEIGEMLGDPSIKVDLPPEDYFKIYGKHKPGHEPNPVRPKYDDDLDAVIAEMKRLGK